MAEWQKIKWDTTFEDWNNFCFLWDECVRLVGGAARIPEEAWDAYKNIKEKNKKKVIKVIVWLRGEKFEEEKPIEDYKITVEDIQMLLEEYKKQNIDKKINITVSNINVE